MVTERYKYYVREFLNPPGLNGLAAVNATVRDYDQRRAELLKEYEEKKELSQTWIPSCIELTISDCNRMVSLDFSLDSKDLREAAVYKIDKLLDVLSQLKVYILEDITFAEKLDQMVEECEKNKENADHTVPYVDPFA